MSNISVIQIFKKNTDPKKIIENNANFLNTLKIEYIIYDGLMNFEILSFIKNVNSAKYFRQNSKNIKEAVLECGELSSGNRLIFLSETDYLNSINVSRIESNRINILKEDLKKIKDAKIEKLDLENIYLFLKKDKNIIEKIKLAFKFIS